MQSFCPRAYAFIGYLLAYPIAGSINSNADKFAIKPGRGNLSKTYVPCYI